MDGAGRRAGVPAGYGGPKEGGRSLMLLSGGLEGSPGHPLCSVTLEGVGVLPAISCRVNLMRDTSTQDIQKSINLISPGNCAED